jgi:excinuclease ABC subunit C
MVDLTDIAAQPGIYVFKDEQGQVLYIGKAVNLRSRVRSYWRQASWRDRPKLGVLVPQVAEVETILTSNPKEAILLEASLIHKHQPKYNVLLKDDHKFPWLAVTYGEDFPRLIPVKNLAWVKRAYPKAKLYGPYTDMGSMYSTLRTARDLFPLRKRAKPAFRDRPCLNYHLGRCLGPCQGLVTRDEYDRMLQQLDMFLQGKHQDLLEELRCRMEEASERQDFERAAKYRDRIRSVERTSENQSIMADDPDCQRDLVGLAREHDEVALQVFKMRHGKLVGRESYMVALDELHSLTETIVATLQQAYTWRQDGDIPREVFLESLEGFDPEPLREILSELAGRKVTVAIPQRGTKRDQVELATHNATQQLRSKQRQQAKNLLAAQTLQEALELSSPPLTIDCFDVSHLQGTQVVASCVRFSEGAPHKEKYRRLKISQDTNDDFRAMREAVTRRYRRHPEDIPDLIVIDGGKGQLNAAMLAIADLGQGEEAEVVSLAKKDEEVYCPDGNKIVIPRNSPALHLLQRARDEAHRFALSYGRKRRSKSMKQSLVDSIPEVGSRTRDRIMKTFTKDQLLNASPQELNDKLKIGPKRADRLWQSLQRIRQEEPAEPNRR